MVSVLGVDTNKIIINVANKYFSAHLFHLESFPNQMLYLMTWFFVCNVKMGIMHPIKICDELYVYKLLF